MCCTRCNDDNIHANTITLQLYYLHMCFFASDLSLCVLQLQSFKKTNELSCQQIWYSHKKVIRTDFILQFRLIRDFGVVIESKSVRAQTIKLFIKCDFRKNDRTREKYLHLIQPYL